MDIRSLNTFIQVAETGSFTKAGELLGYAQPTVSVQIKQLETELQAKLFDRIGHTVRLTAKGRDILPYAQRVCLMCQEMTHQSGSETTLSGTIRLATADSMSALLFSEGFVSFRERYPGISLKVTTAGTAELFRLLDHNEVDMVFTLDSHIYNSNYVTAAEEQVGVHFVIAAGHPLAQRECLDIRELLTQPFLLTEKGMSYRRLLDEALAQNSLEIRPIFEVSRAELLCELAEKGMGVTFLPDYVTQKAVSAGTLTRLSVPGYEPDLWKQLLYRRDKWVSPQMQAVISHFTGQKADTL